MRRCPLALSPTLLLLPALALAQPAAPAAGPPAPPPDRTSTAAPSSLAPSAPSAAAVAAARRVRKPLVATVLAGTTRVPGYRRLKEYTAPALEPEPPLEPTEVTAVQITEFPEALVLARPYYPSGLLGAIAPGSRVAVRGVVQGRSARGCAPRLWYAIAPAGYLCSRSVRPTGEAPSTEPALAPLPESHLPFRYVQVLVPEGEKVPMWASLQELRAGAEPERDLEHGDTVAVDRPTSVDGVGYWVSVEGKVFPRRGSAPMDKESQWHGAELDEETVFPFGWTTPERAGVWPDALGSGKPAEVLPSRTRVSVLEEVGSGNRRMLRIGEGRWVKASEVNEVRRRERPPGITANPQWIDVDLGEQVLVAYEGDRPVFATTTSSGRAIPTPRGDYPLWAKVTAISMRSQPYEDKAYFVNKVPWVLFFQAHNAIHGAYWHDRFGVSRSHGCINVSPLDARRLFEWIRPAAPPGWTGLRFENLLEAPTVHVHNSHARVDLVQERPVGPPDKELEQQRLEDAEERRAAAASLAPAMAGP